MAGTQLDFGFANIPIVLDHSGISKGARGAGEKIRRSLRTVGEDVRLLGFRISQTFSVAIGGSMALALRESIKFETALVGVAKTVNEAEPVIQALGDAILEMSTSISDGVPIAATKLLEIAEVAGQLGVATRDIVSFTKVIAELGETTNIIGGEGAKQLARFMKVTGTFNSQARLMADAIVNLGNNLATSEAEILTFGLRLAGAGTLLGLTNTEILAMGAVLSSLGLRAEAAGTAFSTLFLKILRASDKGGKSMAVFNAVASRTGEVFSDLVKSNPAKAIQNLLRGLNSVRESGGSLVSVLDALDIREKRLIASVLVAALSWEEFGRATELANEKVGLSGALAEEASLRHATLASQIQFVVNEFKRFLKVVGDVLSVFAVDLLPVFKFVGVALFRMAVGFRAMSKPAQAGVLILGSFLTIIGPLTIALGTFVSMAGIMVGVLGTLSTMLGVTFLPWLVLGIGVVGGLTAALAAAILTFGFFSTEIRLSAAILADFFTQANFIVLALEGVLFAKLAVNKAFSFAGFKTKDSFVERLKDIEAVIVKIEEASNSTKNFDAVLKDIAENGGDGFEIMKDKLEQLIFTLEVTGLDLGLIQGLKDAFKDFLGGDAAKTALEVLNAMLGNIEDSKAHEEIEALSEALSKLLLDMKEEGGLDKAIEEALSFRQGLFPIEALRAELDSLQDLRLSAPDIIDEETILAAFREMWERYSAMGVEAGTALSEHLSGLNTDIAEKFIGIITGMDLKKFREEARESSKAYREFMQTIVDKTLEAKEVLKKDFLTAVDKVSNSLDRFARSVGTKFARGMKKVTGALDALQLGFVKIPDAIDKMADAAAAGFKSMRQKIMLALGVIGLFLELITVAIELFGLFGDKGEEELSRVEKAAEALADAFKDAFQELEDQIIEFVRTGKFQFNDLIDSLLEDLLRIGIRASILAPIASFLFGIDLFGKSLDPLGGSVTKSAALAPAFASASASNTIIINDQRSSSSPPLDVQKTGNGLIVTITDMVNDAITSGRTDRALRDTYGLRRRTR